MTKNRQRDKRKGHDGLTPTQRQIAGYLQIGLSDEQIATRLQVSPITVRGYVRRLCERFAVHGRVKLLYVLHERRVARMEALIEAALQHSGACPCRCCDQIYEMFTKGMQEDGALD